jgi:hypothetical protein
MAARISSGTVSTTSSAPATWLTPLGHQVGHLVNVAVRAVVADQNFHRVSSLGLPRPASLAGRSRRERQSNNDAVGCGQWSPPGRVADENVAWRGQFALVRPAGKRRGVPSRRHSIAGDIGSVWPVTFEATGLGSFHIHAWPFGDPGPLVTPDSLRHSPKSLRNVVLQALIRSARARKSRCPPHGTAVALPAAYLGKS